jgi:SAM-dependent methyltransferase
MYSDIVELRSFYDHSLGHVAQRMIARKLRETWPDVRGQTLLGIGYAVPYLGVFASEADRVLAAMPATQGAMRWPRPRPNRVTLCEDTDLPFHDNAIDRIVLVHALEVSESWRQLVRECWRVLNPSGKLIVVVPSRRGLWARSERTPFGHGHPYTSAQLSRLLRQESFDPEPADRALYVPPFRWRFLVRTARFWERVGYRLFRRFAGVIVMEANKSMLQPITGEPVARQRLVFAPDGAMARTRQAAQGPGT